MTTHTPALPVSRRRTLLGSAALAAVPLSMPFISKAGAADPIRIGLLLAKTGQIAPQTQGASPTDYTRRIKKDDGEIDWTRPAVEVWRRVRAYSPWPGAYTRWQGRQIKIIEATPLPAMEAASPGQVVNLTNSEAFGVGTGDGVLGVIALQLEGKRAMSAVDFLRGQRDFVGAQLPS